VHSCIRLEFRCALKASKSKLLNMDDVTANKEPQNNHELNYYTHTSKETASGLPNSTEVEYVLLPKGTGGADSWLCTAGTENILYLPLHGLLVEVSKEGADSVRRWAAQNVHDSITREIARLIDGNPAPTSRMGMYEEFAPTLVGLGLTAQCTLRCAYCHSEAGSRGSEVMPVEVADAALNFVADCAERTGRKFEVSFIGPGEPTKPWQLFRHCVAAAEELAASRGLVLQLSMPTNGFFDKKQCEYIVEHFDRVCLSFDGPSWIQNLQRPLANGGGSFQSVYETAKFFHDNWGKGRRDFRFTIRATVSQEGLDQIDKIHSFFRSEFPCANTAYETLKPLGRGKICASSRVTIPDSNRFAYEISRLVAEDESEIVLNSGAGSLGELKRSFCKALAMPTMNVTPNGRVLACQCDIAADYYEYGRFSPSTGRFIFDHARIKTFQRLTVDDFPECTRCIARHHCAGDCHELRRVEFRRCEEIRALLLTRLWKQVDHS
jgi:uncharacterized protein